MNRASVSLECGSMSSLYVSFVFFFNDTATTEIYTLSLHDALPIWACWAGVGEARSLLCWADTVSRSEEHTSELQSLAYLVCRLLLEKKNIHDDLASAGLRGTAPADTRTHRPHE